MSEWHKDGDEVVTDRLSEIGRMLRGASKGAGYIVSAGLEDMGARDAYRIAARLVTMEVRRRRKAERGYDAAGDDAYNEAVREHR